MCGSGADVAGSAAVRREISRSHCTTVPRAITECALPTSSLVCGSGADVAGSAGVRREISRSHGGTFRLASIGLIRAGGTSVTIIVAIRVVTTSRACDLLRCATRDVITIGVSCLVSIGNGYFYASAI